VHGGVYSVLAESICSRATFDAVKADGKLAFGQSNNATLLRPISEGHINAAAQARHRGATIWVWQVEITDDEERLCALVQIAVAVRDAPAGGT
jgi:1,4-dihydroxy-2-naphthoyl-CoA hydrolase